MYYTTWGLPVYEFCSKNEINGCDFCMLFTTKQIIVL